MPVPRIMRQKCSCWVISKMDSGTKKYVYMYNHASLDTRTSPNFNMTFDPLYEKEGEGLPGIKVTIITVWVAAGSWWSRADCGCYALESVITGFTVECFCILTYI